METQSLTEYLAEHSEPDADMADRCAYEPWYNRYGDCIEYQTEHVAIVADRIDNYLTIYRSAETNTPIGFQLKDVSALMKKHEADLYGVAWTRQETNLVSVSYLLMAALGAGTEPLSIRKRLGYSEAVRRLSKNDEIPLEV